VTVSFWCSAQGLPWSWTWRPYIGVWLLIGSIAGSYAYAVLRLTPRRFAGDDRPTTRREILLFGLGVLVLWIGSDWPIATLGAGYLLSVKTLQYLLFVYVAPGLMLLGMPRWLLRRMIRGRIPFRIAKLLTRPLIPLIVVNGVLLGSNLPVVVDGIGKNQFLVFALDITWMLSGFILWWPALGRLPELNPMSYPTRIGYLLLNIFLPTVPASFLTFGQFPIYSRYELAPRVYNISAVTDQQLAGITMKVGGGLILFSAMTVMFFRWHRREEARERADEGARSDSTT